jgi:hypothetical protein
VSAGQWPQTLLGGPLCEEMLSSRKKHALSHVGGKQEQASLLQEQPPTSIPSETED